MVFSVNKIHTYQNPMFMYIRTKTYYVENVIRSAGMYNSLAFICRSKHWRLINQFDVDNSTSRELPSSTTLTE